MLVVGTLDLLMVFVFVFIFEFIGVSVWEFGELGTSSIEGIDKFCSSNEVN